MEKSIQNSNPGKIKFPVFFWRITSSHMISYFIMGIIAATTLNYRELFESNNLSCLMRPFDSPLIFAGPSLQVIRGLIFSLALWYFKDVFLFRKYGWLKLWVLVVGLSILSTTGAAPGSIEGMIYTKIPILDQMKGYFEVMPQTLAFSAMVFYWFKHPKRVWNIVSIVIVSLIVFFGAMALLMQAGSAN